MITTRSTSTPTVGRARAALATLMIHVALPVWPIQSPSGRAITSEMLRAIRLNPMCASSCAQMPVSKAVPCQWAGSVIQLKTSPIIRGPRGGVGRGSAAEGARGLVGWGSWADRPSPGGQHSVDHEDESVEDEREQHAEDDAEHDRRVVGRVRGELEALV